ncbi:PTS fructose transporter subunit IIC [Treponema phagedenis]|uniref:PTS fructose transporter subunit IIC n=1 Tax=Treponema phagedenis TaxID=162 RepID=A0A0B7GV04_TREPH|nr:fructose-specific PTS transporter subunit EIIC [Treponema phagedenis]NVP24348.1 PTS sugar transporter subunit IIA [Treponema phagedenis]QEJ96042.1 PTS fructose transporter subunit IIC [Treponema phagedenis]QEJ99058.1 PTS fructose transporter subunit IIC [Treponema phagedenis]QEK04569.1 PTS fructose transporter subunit IIC [Treponema phagedenis]QEK06918.1 PTS fructose transporter subunit IIC [Treponema phagedenis]
MRIRDLLDPKSISLNGFAGNKDDALNQIIDLMAASGKIADKAKYAKGVYAREEEATTAVGDGVAIPHCRSDAVKEAGLAAMTFSNGVDFDAPDGEKVKVLFLIAAPETKDNVHVDVLSKLSTLLLNEDFTKNLLEAKNIDEFLSVIDEAESEKDAQEMPHQPTENAKAKLLAVTGCPTGIAHTYMAAEALQKHAFAKGCTIKVETRGTGGTKNELTAAEIAEADCIIVAADTQVPLERFNGKKLIQCKVADGINKAETLIEKAMRGDASIYHAKNDTGAAHKSEDYKKDSVAHVIYTHLMNGVSYMLPFVVGGGILIAIAFLIDGLTVDLNSLPVDQRSGFGSITPIAKIFMSIGGGSFSFMLPILAGFIAMSIADRPGLVAGFVGGYIAANGKSGFLGAMAAGFIAGYCVQLIKKLLSGLPKAFDGIKAILLYPLLGIFVTGLILTFVIEPPIGALNTVLNTTLSGISGSGSIILGIILGGMMSVDMGGPVNKAAYVFGTASIAAGNYNIMAAVMVGGMVPPIAIAISTIIFKHKFTVQERKAGPANFIMGLSFITEGAIPFAASDPLRVLPACIIGSALAGGISMAANCTLMAPHGGIFVFPVVGGALMYLVALLAGSIVGALLLGLTKKPVHE